NAIEETLHKIWSALLGVKQLGVEDDFFLIGGNSIIATQILSRIQRHFSVELSIRELFFNPTIRACARLLEQALGKGEQKQLVRMHRADRQQALLASPAQQRIWFLEKIAAEQGARSAY